MPPPLSLVPISMPVTTAPPPTVVPPVVIPFLFLVPPMVILGWADTPTPAPAPRRPPTVPSKELPPELPADHLDMHEIAIPTPITIILLVLPAGSLAKICNRREISNNWAAGIVPTLQGLQGSGGLILFLELDIDIADHVVSEIITYVEGLDFTKFTEFLEDVLVKILEMLLYLSWVNWLSLGIYAWGNHIRTLVHVGKDQRGGYSGSVMEAGAAVSVTTCADLEVERAVHAVFLRPED